MNASIKTIFYKEQRKLFSVEYKQVPYYIEQ